MPEPDAISALIDRIVAGARIPSRGEREDLRLELLTHFEEAGASPESVAYAIRRFGDEAAVIDSLRRVYHWNYLAWYLVKIAASAMSSLAAALLIVAAFNLRLELETEVFRLAPGFSRAAGLAVAVAVSVVAAWEIVRRPFSPIRAAIAVAAYAAVCGVAQLLVAHSVRAFIIATALVVLGYGCSCMPSRLLRWLLMFVAFALAEYGVHAVLSVAFPPGRAAIAGALLAAVWGATVFILRYADAAFTQLFDAAPR